MREGLEALTKLIGPMLPHIAEEMWERLGHKTLLTDTPWPKADPALLIEDTVTIAVQVNGKLRATITLPATFRKKKPKLRRWPMPMSSAPWPAKTPRKIIVVPNKIINVVA